MPPHDLLDDGLDLLTKGVSQLLTPSPSLSSRSISPEPATPVGESAQRVSNKKRKKKKSKKAAKARDASETRQQAQETRPPVLCISRNKHWRYISSYHGPWLQLPVELLESLLLLNMDPATYTSETRLPTPPSNHAFHSRPRDRGFAGLGDNTPPDSPRPTLLSLPAPAPFPYPKPGCAAPPPIDPGVFRSVAGIRRLIDEASELSVRASSGLSAAALGAMRSASAMGGSPWATAQSLGINPLGDTGGGGRTVTMSATRVHRLRALAVQKLAVAYRTDEIASSVMVMQGGSVFDDIAERVLKVDPFDADAKYVHFFHEKIPSRHVAESTTTQVLDELIAVQPHRLEFYRTRGIVHCFRDEYAQAAKDFTFALKESRAQRRAHAAHFHGAHTSDAADPKRRKKKGKGGSPKTNAQAPLSGADPPADGVRVPGLDGEPLLVHPSVRPDAPDPLEPQCLFLRGAAHLAHALFLVERAVLALEGVPVPGNGALNAGAGDADAVELRLCRLPQGRYGGVETGHQDGPLGDRDGSKARAYRAMLASAPLREQILGLVRKSLRDHERFLAHFDALEGPAAEAEMGDAASRTEAAFSILESRRPGAHKTGANSSSSTSDLLPVVYTTYHPLLVESLFSALLCHLLLGDFATLLPTLARTAAAVEALEGYPIFLPPRSMAQAEFAEVLERLAGCWRNGTMPHSLSRMGELVRHGKGVAVGVGKELQSYPEHPMRRVESPEPEAEQDVDADFDPHAPSSSASRSSSYQALFPPSGGSANGNGNGPTPPRSRSTTATTTATSSTFASDTPPLTAPRSGAGGADLAEALDCARILLAPIVRRQRERAERGAERQPPSQRPVPINIALHGPRVEVILAWMGAVHLPELDTFA